jgi:hypothetical protein
MIAALALSASLNLLTPAGREVAGTWSGQVLNCHGNECMAGFSWFEVRNGRYIGRTLAKKYGQTCLSYDPTGWTGTLYKLDRDKYFALNDGATEGYLLHISRDRHTASATYMGIEPGVVETNRFERGPVDVPRLLQFFQPWRCPNP